MLAISPMRRSERCNTLKPNSSKKALTKKVETRWPSTRGTGRGHSVLEVIRAAENATGRPVRRKIVPRRPSDPPILVADPGKAQRVLGWTAERNLGDIVSRAWIWMQKNSKGEQAQLSML
jgi:UDP-glucose 4-epimerase